MHKSQIRFRVPEERPWVSKGIDQSMGRYRKDKTDQSYDGSWNRWNHF